jgi:hypothetical protein
MAKNSASIALPTAILESQLVVLMIHLATPTAMADWSEARISAFVTRLHKNIGLMTKLFPRVQKFDRIHQWFPLFFLFVVWLKATTIATS